MGKTVLITGSSRGIGKAMAEKFALEDYNVVINGRNQKPLDDLALKLREYNKNILAVRCDVSVYNDTINMFSQINNAFGPVDILINNAGVSYVGLFQQMTRPDWQSLVENNLYSVINCSHLAIPLMVERKRGVILNISSIWGNVGASCEVLYSATKGAVNSFTKALAKELAPSSIRVNAISCGLVDTEMNSFLSELEMQDFIDQIPTNKLCSPQEIAELAFFLCLCKTPSLTGQIITVDGGLT